MKSLIYKDIADIGSLELWSKHLVFFLTNIQRAVNYPIQHEFFFSCSDHFVPSELY
jgi:hypothetical protein